MSKYEQENWHTISPEIVLEKLSTSQKGLSRKEAEQRFEKTGPNILVEEKSKSAIFHILKQFKSPLVYLLVIAAGISLAAGKTVDTAVIAAVVFLNTILGFIQEWRAENALAALKELSAPKTTVIRDGKQLDVPAARIVPGDILVLTTGDRVAADARVIESTELRIDESSLTGESEPVAKNTEPLKKDIPLADMSNMVFMSTLITGGSGLAAVTGTGMNTAIGKIAHEVRTTEREITPLQRRLGRLSVYIGALSLALAGIVFLLGFAKGYDLLSILLYSVALAVSVIPEGLPAVISITLALGIRRMADRNALIRRMLSVETLGSTTVICSDKTGTITKNEMTVRKIWAGGYIYKVTGEGYKPEGEVLPEDGKGDRAALDMLMLIGCLANDAKLILEDNAWKIQGTPTEGAILVSAQKKGHLCEELKEKFPRTGAIPFSSEQKYMAALHNFPEQSQSLLMVKGAPDRILPFCSHIMENSKPMELNEQKREQVKKANNALAEEGLRVLGGAWKSFEPGKKGIAREEMNGLVFTGMWGMEDPARPEAVRAIEAAKKAGIRIIMLTGDHARTARTIASKAGIETEEVLTGEELKKHRTAELKEKILKTNVFARVSPSHKVELTRLLKNENQVVAMTGDGVNDAPALKNANIGVAMGMTGTDVAREAADMVLTDDNFATIVAAVEEGRVIFSNIRRVIFFLITTNLGEVITLITALIIGLPLPVTAVMILWINLLTDGACTIPLGLEPKHKNVMNTPPRPPEEGIINRLVAGRIMMLAPVMAAGVLITFASYLDISQGYAQTMAFTTLAAFQWFQALNARSQNYSIFKIGPFSNKWLNLGLGIAILLQLGLIYTEAGRTLFGTIRLKLSDWFFALLAGSSILFVEEILKFFRVK